MIDDVRETKQLVEALLMEYLRHWSDTINDNFDNRMAGRIKIATELCMARQALASVYSDLRQLELGEADKFGDDDGDIDEAFALAGDKISRRIRTRYKDIFEVERDAPGRRRHVKKSE